jgi:hypothetical protein
MKTIATIAATAAMATAATKYQRRVVITADAS